MERKIYKNLLDWKFSENRKPLILQGARQVGKTYIVNVFGEREYSNVIYCNFEREQGLKEFFNSLNPKEILRKLSVYKRKEIIPNYSLVVFDEIQTCPEALTSLKYFCEEASEYHIVAMGSLLGISVHRGNFSFPVGKVEFLNMYPMDFEEFLLANKEEYLVSEIKKCFEKNKPMDLLFHERLLMYYKEYLYVGGMPEVVNEYLQSHNYDLIRIKQQAILDSYFNDMGKYNRESEIPKTKLVYKNISVQLAKENKKFKYVDIKSGGRANEFRNSIEWLSMAGIAKQLYKVEQIKLPLEAYKSLSDFKFYMNDVGLCSASLNIFIDDILGDFEEFNEFKGGLTENFVFNELNINLGNCYYWVNKNQVEIDFVARIDSKIIPIEVKSKDNVKSRSLNEYIKNLKPEYAIRISTKNFGFENGIKSIPLYAIFCIK